MKLLVIRHAIAVSRDDWKRRLNDDLRPLTEEGVRKMKKNAEGLQHLVPRPDLLITSPLMRAKQTVGILEQNWPNVDTIECEELRPERLPQDFAAWVQRRFSLISQSGLQARFLAMVGHEPHLTNFITWALASGVQESFIEMRKGGACLLEFDGEVKKANGRLLWCLTPAILRKIRD